MFLTKQELEATVEAYDIDVTGLSWPQKQGAVSKYLAEHGLEVVKPEVEDGARRESAFEPIEGQMIIDDVVENSETGNNSKRDEQYKTLTPEQKELVDKWGWPEDDPVSMSFDENLELGQKLYDGEIGGFVTNWGSHQQNYERRRLGIEGKHPASHHFSIEELSDQQQKEREYQGDMTRPSATSFSEPMDVVPLRLRAEYEANAHMHIPTPGEPVIIKGKAKRIQLDVVEETTDPWLALGLQNKRLMFAPELITDPNRLIRYKEDLGPNATSEDVNYTGEDLDKRNIQGAPGTSNGISGTYQVTEIPGERCVATSTLPKYNAAIYWDFGPDGKPKTYFPIVEFEGRRGYLYKHATIPNVYSTIFDDPRMREHGYYQRFRENLSQEPYVFYLAGLIAIDIDFTHYMMEEITREEQRRND